MFLCLFFPCCRLLRVIAYRQFPHFAHGTLGRGRRVVIPACVVCKIRDKFPEEDNQYVGFRRDEGD